MVGPATSINHVTQNGGGYGDPVERDPERWRRDVPAARQRRRSRATSTASWSGDASTATEARRDELRRARLEDLENVRDDYEVKRELEVVRRWGDVLDIARDGDDAGRALTESGAVLGPLGDNWRDVAPFRRPRHPSSGRSCCSTSGWSSGSTSTR